MRKIVLLLVLFTIVAITFGQKIAVLDFRAGSGIKQTDADGISATFITYFSPRGYKLVERTQIINVIREQGFQNTTLTEDQMVKVGRIMNLTRIVVGDVNVVGGVPNLDVRVLNVETGEIIARDGVTFSWSDYRTTMQQIAQRLADQIGIIYSGDSQNVTSQPSKLVQTSGKSPSGKVETILGYLQVYPEDLGSFNAEPRNIIAAINKQNLYGYNDWRLPYDEELILMAAVGGKLGIIDESKYMTSGYSSSYSKIVRLVRTFDRNSMTNSGLLTEGKVETILGYLQVFPVDIGIFDYEPRDVTKRINFQRLHGYGDWRLPKDEELSLMATASDKLGIGSINNYMSEENRGSSKNRIVRLVRTIEKVTITFNPNGGNGNMPTQEIEKGVPQKLNENNFIRSNYMFDSWNTSANGSGTKYSDTADVNGRIYRDLTLYAQWKDITHGKLNGHEWVDLGLPSGIRWATCNVGATYSYQSGDFYAWGETERKSSFRWSTYKYCRCMSDDGLCKEFTKYCNGNDWGYNGFSDNLNTLQPEDDAATVNWGEGWRTPTKEEFEELINNCNWTKDSDGYKAVGPNGNSIFIPAAGSKGYLDGYESGFTGTVYWTSSLFLGFDDKKLPPLAWKLRTSPDKKSQNPVCFFESRYFGNPVRAVCR